jgi:homoserine kinase type II
VLRRLVRACGSGLAPPLSDAERAALPVAIARQPLWSFVVWIAQLDDERAARAHAAGLQPHVDWALGVLRDLQRWRDAFS